MTLDICASLFRLSFVKGDPGIFVSFLFIFIYLFIYLFFLADELLRHNI